MPISCNFGPNDLLLAVPCVFSVSKDVEGELLPTSAEKEECKRLECVTLTTTHAIRAKVSAHDCDSKRSQPLDGGLSVSPLTTIFEDADPNGRGIHAGNFRWVAPGLLITGRIQGVTNAGVLRKPLSQACEECRNPGAMVGRLCGTIRRALFDPALVGAVVTGVYRFEYKPDGEGGSGGIIGALEGAIVQECP